MRLQTVLLYVKDLEGLAAFYERVLGDEPVPATRTDAWAEFALDGITLGLHAIPPHIAAEIEIASPPTPREDTPIKLVFQVPDVEAEARRLQGLGVTIQRRPWGACDVIDPEGNIFSMV